MKVMKLKKMFRLMEARDAKIDAESRTIEFPFCSDAPVERYYGEEVLSMAPGACDLTRAIAGAMPFLFNHNMDDLRGIVEKIYLGPDSRMWAQVRIAKTAAGDETLALINDGMLPNVSFGYMINDIELQRGQDPDGDDDSYLITNFTPFEISAVTIPADFSVGFNRSETNEEYEVNVKGLREPKKEEEIKIMPEAIDNVQERKNIRIEEQKRSSEVLALGVKFDQNDLARELIASDKSLEECRTAFLEKISVRKEVIAPGGESLGLNKKEIERFSVLRAVRAMANPNSKSAQDDAAFEREVSLAGSKARGKDSAGFFVPYEVLQKREMTKGTLADGGYLVGTDHRADLFIEMLRKKSALQRAGARVLSGLKGDISIPSQSGGGTAYWVGEGTNVTTSKQAFGQVAMAPKTLGVTTDLSRKIMLQSDPSIEALVQSDLAKVLALAADLAGMYGLGSSNQPLGIVHTASIKTQAIADAGNVATYLELIAMETKIAADDADVANMKYIFNATARGALKGVLKFSAAGSEVAYEKDGTVNGYGSVVSNQITTGDYLFGNFDDLMIGYWSGLDLIVDQSALSLEGGTRLVVLQDMDVAVRHASSFCFANHSQ